MGIVMVAKESTSPTWIPVFSHALCWGVLRLLSTTSASLGSRALLFSHLSLSEGPNQCHLLPGRSLLLALSVTLVETLAKKASQPGLYAILHLLVSPTVCSTWVDIHQRYLEQVIEKNSEGWKKSTQKNIATLVFPTWGEGKIPTARVEVQVFETKGSGEKVHGIDLWSPDFSKHSSGTWNSCSLWVISRSPVKSFPAYSVKILISC